MNFDPGTSYARMKHEVLMAIYFHRHNHDHELGHPIYWDKKLRAYLGDEIVKTREDLLPEVNRRRAP